VGCDKPEGYSYRDYLYDLRAASNCLQHHTIIKLRKRIQRYIESPGNPWWVNPK